MLTQKPKGTKDIYGMEIYNWHWIEQLIREVGETYGITEIRTPIFEHTELFTKNVGETTDIVNKEMYTFHTKGGRSLTLRPEGTAGVARSFVEQKLYGDMPPTKVYYVGSFFRYEQPQNGRTREFHQFGVEFIGSWEPESDAEVISIAREVLNRAGVGNAKLHINCIGEAESRENYHNLLKGYIGENLDNMCSDCKERFEKNPMRVLDCKKEGCKKIMGSAPSILDSLVDADKSHFEKVLKILDIMGIKYIVDPKIVRGLDYYTRTVFEFICDDIGTQSTVCGGGRYDTVIEQTGGPKTGACGFAMGMERLLMSALNSGVNMKQVPRRTVFIGYIGNEGRLASQKIVYELRQKGMLADGETSGKSLKNQLKYANKIGSVYSLVLGDDEMASGKAKLKNMDSGYAKEIEIDKLYEFLKEEGF